MTSISLQPSDFIFCCRLRRTDLLALKDLAQILPYNSRRLRGIDRFPDALPLVVLDDRPGLLVEPRKAFAERFYVVV